MHNTPFPKFSLALVHGIVCIITASIAMFIPNVFPYMAGTIFIGWAACTFKV